VRTLYQRDLAWIHHHAYGNFATNAAPQLLRILRRVGIRQGTLVDLACGSGIWANAAQKSGFHVIGIDRSRAMLELAKHVAPKAQFRCGSLHNASLPPCDVVTIIGEGIQYLQPNESKLPPVTNLFKRVAAALRPGGLFIFDAIARANKPMNYYHGRTKRDWTVFVEAKQKGNLLTRQIVIFRKVDGYWRRSDEIHSVSLINVDETIAALRGCGFNVQATRKYGSFELAPNRVGFIAQKKR
jgi:SAM-dependent methyltransferase